VLVLLVGTVFLVQNNFYSHVYVRGQTQENARAMKEMVESEIRGVAAGGVTTADSSRMVVRSNLAIGVVCGYLGGDVDVFIPAWASSTDSTEIGGFGYRSSAGVWEYHDRTWTQLHATGSQPAAVCAGNGADTTGVSSSFYWMNYIDDDTGLAASTMVGSVVMFYRRTEFKFNSSSLISGDRALFWGLEGGTLRELVTGMAPGAHFEFRTGTNTWSKSVTGGSLANINAVRVVAQAIGKGESSAELTYDFTLNVDIPLQNAY
jgi:hypothetical protein